MLPRRSLLAALATPPLIARAEVRMRVVATFSVLADMASEVGGAAITVTSLVPPDGDVHVYEPRPSDLRSIGAARVLVENGLGLEGWIDRLRGAAGFGGVRVIAASAVKPRRFMEDGRAAIDPHAWQDPRNGILYAHAIADGFARAVPDRAGLWRDRTATYAAAIAATDRWIEATLAQVPPEKRKIVTSHDAFGYYGARYGIELRFIEGISTDTEPSAREMARLIEDIRREGIRAVFIENMTDPRLVRTLARETGAVVGPPVYSDALSPPGGPADTYLKMLRYNTSAFAAAMLSNR
jgi:zinc/manganese transport system substrate-binding protein